MAETLDEQFFERADAHIDLSNDQIDEAGRGKVSASMLYATARFNAWICACRSNNKTDMELGREENIAYFVEQYRKMLSENYDDYIDSFETYMTKD